MTNNYSRPNLPPPKLGSNTNPEQLAWLKKRFEATASKLSTCKAPRLRRLYLAEMKIILDEIDGMLKQIGAQ